MSKVDRVEIEDYDECEELLENIQGGGSRSTCGALVVKVNDYIKKPLIEHDLTGILKNYLGVLQESGVYIQNGIFNMNFAEAALLLQGSVQLYGKKVDLLWDFVLDYLRRNMSYEEKTEENKDQFDLLEERQAMFKRKRKVVELHPEEREKGPKKTFIIDKTSANVQGMSFNDFKTYLNGSLSSNECVPSVSYNENWAQRSTQSKNTMWEHKIQHGNSIPSENSEENQLLTNLDSTVTHGTGPPVQYDLSELNIYGETEPMGDYGNSSVFDESNRDLASQHRQVHQYNIPQTQTARSDVQDVVLQWWLHEKSMRIDQVYAKWDDFIAECTQVERSLYQLKTKAKLNKPSCYYQPAESHDEFSMLNDGDLDLERPLGHSTPSIEHGSASSLHSNEHAINQELSEIMGKRNDSIRKTMDSDMESGVFDSFTTLTPVKSMDGMARPLSESSEGIGIETDSRAATPLPPLGEGELSTGAAVMPVSEKSLIEEVAREECQRKVKVKKTLILDDDADDDDCGVIKPKRVRRIKERERPVITTDLEAFNKFLRQHYTPSPDEGDLEPLQDDPEDDDDVLGDLPDIDDSMLGTSIGTDCSQPSSASPSQQAEHTERPSKTRAAPADASKEKTFAEIMGNDAATRLQHVLDWRKFITEKIGSQKKSDFDIHAEETHVIESIGEVGKSMHYKDMCAGMSAAQVSHNFIAMLHLANTHNVDITGIQRNKLSNDTLEVKLLSTDRHHEHLDEYNAPSIEEKQEKLVCVNKALKRHQHSVNKSDNSAKRVRRK